MEPAIREAKLDAVSELVRLAIRSAETGHWDGASQHLDEASAAYQAIPPAAAAKEARYLAVGAAIAEGKGQLALRAAHVEEGVYHLEQAVALRAAEEEAGGSPQPLPLSVSLINLTGACHRLGRFDDALRYNQLALERLRPLDQPPARIFLAAAIEARGNLLSLMDRHADALAALAESGALAAELAAQGLPGAPQLLTEILVAHARAAAKAGDPLDALRLSQAAADAAWERFEKDPQADKDALSHFVAAQMNLVTFAEQAGRFAQGEDALFKVLRLAGPDPRVIARGMAFYDKLLTLGDEHLEAGNLPRDEVEESRAQLLELAAAVRQNRPTVSA